MSINFIGIIRCVVANPTIHPAIRCTPSNQASNQPNQWQQSNSITGGGSSKDNGGEMRLIDRRTYSLSHTHTHTVLITHNFSISLFSNSIQNGCHRIQKRSFYLSISSHKQQISRRKFKIVCSFCAFRVDFGGCFFCSFRSRPCRSTKHFQLLLNVHVIRTEALDGSGQSD